MFGVVGFGLEYSGRVKSGSLHNEIDIECARIYIVL